MQKNRCITRCKTARAALTRNRHFHEIHQKLLPIGFDKRGVVGPLSLPEPLHRQDCRIIPLVARTWMFPRLSSRHSRDRPGIVQKVCRLQPLRAISATKHSSAGSLTVYPASTVHSTTRASSYETTSNLKIFAYILITKFRDRGGWREEGKPEESLRKCYQPGKCNSRVGNKKNSKSLFAYLKCHMLLPSNDVSQLDLLNHQ